MPDSALYWYGWTNGIEDCTSSNGWSASAGITLATPTHNTNNISLSAVGDTSKYVAVATSQKKNAGTTINFIYKGVTPRSNGMYLIGAEYSTKSMASAASYDTYSDGGVKYKQRVMQGTNYFALNGTGASSEIHAIWV